MCVWFTSFLTASTHQRDFPVFIFHSFSLFFGWILNRWTPLFINLKKERRILYTLALLAVAGLYGIIYSPPSLPYAALYYVQRGEWRQFSGGRYSLRGCRLISPPKKETWAGCCWSPFCFLFSCGLYLSLPFFLINKFFFGGPSVGARPYSWWKTIKSIENQLPSNSERTPKLFFFFFF